MATDAPENILIDQLVRCRHQMLSYGDQHMAKNPPQVEKARVNYDLAAAIDEAIMSYAEAKASGHLTPSA